MRQVTILLLLALAAYVAAKCSTRHPQFETDSDGRRGAAPACVSANPCDVAATRDSYIYNSQTSQTLNMRLNVIYFGNLTGDALTNYEQQMAFFTRRYMELLGINVMYNTTVVTSGPYLEVHAENNTVHLEMALAHYRPGAMTVMFANLNPNPERTLGYASQLPHELPENRAEWYTIMTTSSVNPNGTTVHHEVGHMLGLYHTFIQTCNECAEAMTSPDRNVVGDLINDTLPVRNQFGPCSVLQNNTDCLGNILPDPSELPLTNYMAYTDDDCQTGFTPQQSGRVRCYASTTLSFLLENPPSNSPNGGTPSGGVTPNTTPSGNTPTAVNVPSARPTATPTKVSGANQIAAFSVLGAAALLML